MPSYSNRAQELARQLRETATRNLRRSGRTVEQDPETGRTVVDGGQRGGLFRSDEVDELRAEPHLEFSDEMVEKIWNSLDGHPGFRKLSASRQRRGFELLAAKISEGELPATAATIESWKPAIYSEIGLRASH
jgi:hypothetical protein